METSTYEPPLTQRELWVAEDMLRDAPMTVAIALYGEGNWPQPHVNTARRVIRDEYQRRVDAENSRVA